MSVNFDDPVKQEVWNALRALNDAWTKGNPNDLKNYFHKDMVAITATDRERLEGKEACFTSWNNFAKAAKIHHWNELEPRIQIYGNAAVVTYYFDMSFDMGGQAVKLGGRDMFVFVKEGGKWLAVADQFSAYPAT
ncbi:MAG: nuclear transport factor 2 family protein [Gammaproteobacteria bacterium]|nr:nuclear transport factor 2 family protein [Gammaproteobacteria bacterium]